MDEQFKLNSPCRGLCAKGCGRQDKQLNTYDYLADIPGNDEATDRNLGISGKVESVLEEAGFQTVVFTFDFHPMSLLTGKKQSLIYTKEERLRIVEEMGIDVLIEYPFTAERQ